MSDNDRGRIILTRDRTASYAPPPTILVNFTDLLTLARNYNGVLAADALPAGAPATFAADLATAFAPTNVPEPSTLAACAFALAAARRSRPGRAPAS